jgi:DNA-binding CsgD family transcriptional regulator
MPSAIPTTPAGRPLKTRRDYPELESLCDKAALKPQQRAVLLLWCQDLDYRDIGRVLRISATAARAAVRQAAKKVGAAWPHIYGVRVVSSGDVQRCFRNVRFGSDTHGPELDPTYQKLFQLREPIWIWLNEMWYPASAELCLREYVKRLRGEV